ncbi:MAG: hypothetical protein IID40_07905 [Planctomycetes bacterium]|nr:hypothetical protein [Planctomycetota bacterium]
MDASESVASFFAHRQADPFERHLHDVDFGLIHHITSQRRFANLDSLLRFCRDPKNLSGLLPDRRDRMLFSERLVQGLTDYGRTAGC